MASQLSYEDQLSTGILRQEDPGQLTINRNPFGTHFFPWGWCESQRFVWEQKRSVNSKTYYFHSKSVIMQNGLFFAVSADSFCDTVLVVSNCIMGLFGNALFFLLIAALYMGNLDHIRPPLYSSIKPRPSLMGNLSEDRWKKVHLSDENISSTILWSLRSNLR